MITKTKFDTYKGRDVFLYTLSVEDIKVGVLDFGATLNFIKLNTACGEKNIIVGYDSVQGYLNSASYCGATVGRVANRIANARFTLKGKEYSLSVVENGHCLHGGEVGFDKRFYDARIDGETLTLSLVSPDGDMGFPGRMRFKAEFTLRGRELLIRYCAESDAATLFSPTCHAYFNLNGGGEVWDTLLKINAENYTPVDGTLVPTGEVKSVKGTPLDFTSLKKIGEDYSKLGGKTYDNNFCLNEDRTSAAQFMAGGVSVDAYTDMPGLQLYVGNCAAHDGRGGGWGFCLEPQFYPNAINTENFLSPAIRAGVPAVHYVRYIFGFHTA